MYVIKNSSGQFLYVDNRGAMSTGYSAWSRHLLNAKLFDTAESAFEHLRLTDKQNYLTDTANAQVFEVLVSKHPEVYVRKMGFYTSDGKELQSLQQLQDVLLGGEKPVFYDGQKEFRVGFPTH